MISESIIFSFQVCFLWHVSEDVLMLSGTELQNSYFYPRSKCWIEVKTKLWRKRP